MDEFQAAGIGQLNVQNEQVNRQISLVRRDDLARFAEFYDVAIGDGSLDDGAEAEPGDGMVINDGDE